MKVRCDREKLREGLAIVNNAIPTRATKPVLENICLVATDDSIELLGTDLEVAVRYRLDEVEVVEPGPTVIPARIALDFVRDLSSETVSIETEGSNCVIAGGEDRCELVTVDPEEFPVIARFDETEKVSLQGGTLLRLVTQTAFAAAREGGRYAMHGVLVEFAGDSLKLVATDGRRLALASALADTGKSEHKPAIVPTKGMQLCCRVIHDPLDTIRLQVDEGQIGMKTRNAEIFARLIDGEFPRYAAVLPAQAGRSILASTEVFARKLRLVSNVTGDDQRAVRLRLRKNELEFFGHSSGRGEARAQMEVEYSGGETDIAFNPDYVLDGIKNCERESFRLEFEDRTSPGKFTLGENYVYIVMPITIDA